VQQQEEERGGEHGERLAWGDRFVNPSRAALCSAEVPFWRKAPAAQGCSLDEFLDSAPGEARAASPLDLGRGWQERLAAVTKAPPAPMDLALPAFSLVRGGDLYEAPRASTKKRTEPALVASYEAERLVLEPNGAAGPEREAAVRGVLRLLRGNPAVCRRMLLAKPVRLVIVPRDNDFRRFGFPPNTNPQAAGIFWNGPREASALIGLREELIVDKPYLMAHEMAHAVHFLGFTQKEREDIDRMLLPVYRSRRWVEEALAIYTERAFGAVYTEAELAAPDLYGKTRRDWTDRAVFALFIAELFRPEG
jgi:hypothetical protein